MSEEKIMDEIIEVIREVTEDDSLEINEDSNFIEDLDIMSIEIFQLVNELEERYSIRIEDEDVEKLQTVGDLKEYLLSNYVII